MKGFTCNFEEGKEYRCKSEFVYKLIDGRVFCKGLGGDLWRLSNYDDFFNAEFDEVKPEPKQVPWQEALRAWANGKTITCVHACQNFIFHGNQRLFIDQIGGSLAKEDLAKGLWFIQEG